MKGCTRPGAAVPFPGVAENPFAVMSAKKHEALALGIKHHGAVIARLGAHTLKLPPNRTLQYPVVGEASLTVPATETDEVLTCFIKRHRGIEPAGNRIRFQLTPILAIPQPGFSRGAIAAK